MRTYMYYFSKVFCYFYDILKYKHLFIIFFTFSKKEIVNIIIMQHKIIISTFVKSMSFSNYLLKVGRN